MATPPFNLDTTDPADNAVVSQFPANERAFRDEVNSLSGREHDTSSGHHAFGTGSTASRDAITDWVVGSVWLNTGTTPALIQRVVSIGPVVWENLTSTSSDNTPIGTEFSWAGLEATVPSNYKLCNGQTLSRTTFSTLFGILNASTTGNTHSNTTVDSIPSTTGWKVGWFVSGTNIPAGTTIATIPGGSSITLSQAATGTTSGGGLVVGPHGIGDGVTTFNVPDRRGRVVAGADDMGGTAAGRLGAGTSTGSITRTVASLGAVGGEQQHTPVLTEMFQHAHTASSSFSGNTIGLTDVSIPGTPNDVGAGSGTGPEGSYTPSGTVSTTVNNSGSSSPFNVTQPTGTTNWIIRAL